MVSDWVVLPAVGAMIGAVTNELALRMLFRPYRAVKVLGWTLPFTPGVIPARRGRIAANIAASFESRLLSGDEIRRALASESMKRSLEERLRQALRSGELFGGDEGRQLLLARLRPVVGEAAPRLMAGFAAEAGPELAARMVDRILEGFGPLGAMFGGPLKAKAGPLLAEAVAGLAGEMKAAIEAGRGDAALGELAGRLPELIEPLLPRVAAMLAEGLGEAAAEALGGGGLDLRRRIEERINAMEIRELEEMVLGFSREQFRMITVLGGVLGGLVGLLQCLLLRLWS